MVEDAENLIGYCGLYCGDCHGHTGMIPDLAKELRKELRAARYDKFAEIVANEGFGKVFKDYDKCYDILGAMMKFRCKKGCRNGGGPTILQDTELLPGERDSGMLGVWRVRNVRKLGFSKNRPWRCTKLKLEGTTEFVKGKRYWYSAEKAK